MVSHSTAVHFGELYVWDGGPDTGILTHAKTLMDKLAPEDRETECALFREFMKVDRSPIPSQRFAELGRKAEGIPEWRINMWFELFRHGVVE